MTARYLIVNADDFGLSEGVNRGIILAHELGIVTGASLMTRRPAAASAATYSRSHPRLSVGLHIDLGEWAFRDGAWRPVYEVVPPGDFDGARAEIRRQLEQFRRLVGRPPAQIDSHQHVHREEPLRSIVLGEARVLGVPLRHAHPSIRYCGRFHGQSSKGEPAGDAITPRGLIETLMDLPPGWTELACHPGLDGDAPSPYRAERAVEVATLCDPEVRSSLARAGIELRSFHDALQSRS